MYGADERQLRSTGVDFNTSDFGHWCVCPGANRSTYFRQAYVLPKMISYLSFAPAREPGKPEFPLAPFLRPYLINGEMHNGERRVRGAQLLSRKVPAVFGRYALYAIG